MKFSLLMILCLYSFVIDQDISRCLASTKEFLELTHVDSRAAHQDRI